ncbi:MT-A70-domain-containing protein [Thamnocephalis sphaerospora]|uniref:MT-A70-domain-containing protein n=1 Tax=Thamnocephalis sphaerospora TaxID=78915 RepID=A0A4V1IWV6_9FUNG|nr:MT-A70-domain-containing protein [Thamnocephalis sphaerospora]|eukprot:RKP08889.1 MT-A70-domain-containing protein [Thamnocephalis sphaerospora]
MVDAPDAPCARRPAVLATRALYSRGFQGQLAFAARHFNLRQPYQRANPNKRRRVEPRGSANDTLTQELDRLVADAYQQLCEEAPQAPAEQTSAEDDETAVQDEDATSIDLPSIGSMARTMRGIDRLADDALGTTNLEHDVTQLDEFDLVYTYVVNESDQSKRIRVSQTGDVFLVPPRAQFLASDIEQCRFLKHIAPMPQHGFDLIVMDPPYPNVSAERGSQYATLDMYDLFKLPIAQLLVAPCQVIGKVRPGGLLCCWTTHRPRHRRILLERLFPAWNVDLIGEWCWLKLANTGEPVLPLGTQHRKPYERLLIARRRPQHQERQSASTVSDPSVTNEQTDSLVPAPVPARRVFASTQCTLHSRKPPLDELLAEYLPQQPACLELFARALIPGWTAWGNEPLKFQHTRYFEPDLIDHASIPPFL